MSEKRLRIALQKSGRLADDCFELLKSCGVQVPAKPDRLIFEDPNAPIDLLFLRSGDIPDIVASGKVDAGIVGQNTLLEARGGLNDDKVRVLNELGFSECRLSIAVPENGRYQSLIDLNGATIATSYPNTLKRFADEQGITVDVEVLGGSVEAAPGIGLADAICDIVQSGSTLKNHKLKEIQQLFKSQAVLIGGTRLLNGKQDILNQLIDRIRGTQAARTHELLAFHLPPSRLDGLKDILPSADAPTISDLAGHADLVSVQVLCSKKDSWNVMTRLKVELGATALITTPLSKTLPDDGPTTVRNAPQLPLPTPVTAKAFMPA